MGYRDSDRVLAKVDADEPIFVLRAQDKLSIAAIHSWFEGAKKTLTEEHIKEVRDCIDDFAHWQQMNSGKVKFPD